MRVNILGTEVLGLLDSGASRTIVGSPGYKLLQDLGLKLSNNNKSECRVANGQTCEVLGEMSVPFLVRGNLRVLSVLVAVSLPHTLILGADFWRVMGIVPDLRHDAWQFSKSPVTIGSVDHIRSQTVLTSLQQNRLGALVDRNRELSGSNLGCTNVAEHKIVCNAAPIKQRYYPVSPVIQGYIDKELDEMLAQGIIEKSNSPWSSPILMVKKKDST